MINKPKNIAVAFYIGNSLEGGKKSLLSKTISNFTGHDTSHVEIILTDDNRIDWWYSSHEGEGGYTKRRRGRGLDVDDFVVIDIPEEMIDYDKTLRSLENKEGAKYDYSGVIAHQFLVEQFPKLAKTLDIGVNNKKFFCSEIVSHALIDGGLNLENKPHEYSPGELAEGLAKLMEVKYSVPEVLRKIANGEKIDAVVYGGEYSFNRKRVVREKQLSRALNSLEDLDLMTSDVNELIEVVNKFRVAAGYKSVNIEEVLRENKKIAKENLDKNKYSINEIVNSVKDRLVGKNKINKNRI